MVYCYNNCYVMGSGMQPYVNVKAGEAVYPVGPGCHDELPFASWRWVAIC